MKILIAIIFLSLVMVSSLAAESLQPVEVSHLPPTGKIPKTATFPNMWYYRTEIKNNTNRPLKVIWFEGYLKKQGRWQAANILGRTMRSKDFAKWYTEGAKVTNGIIMPGKVVICDVNWHGSNNSKYIEMKWSYILVDEKGGDYYIEGIVNPKVVKYKNYRSNKPLNRTL